MKEMKEYAEVSAFAPKNADQLKLYQMAIAGFSREEAKVRLSVTDSYFNVIYKQLKDYMSLGVLNNSLRGLSRYQRIHCTIRRNYETASMLLLLDKKSAGIPLAKSTMRKAEKHCLFQIALDLSRRLRSYYGSVDFDKKKYNYYTEKQRLYQQELNWELEAENLFYEYTAHYYQGIMLEDVEGQLASLALLPSKSHRFHYMRLLCQVTHQQIIRKETKMIETCIEAQSIFSEYKDLPYVIRFSFYFRLIAVHLARGEFSQAEIVINKSLLGPTKGKNNWQIIMLHRALLGFHSGKYAIALDAYRKAIKTPKKFRTAKVQERWRIIRAYLELFDLELPGTWRLPRFINSLPATQSDKTGPSLSVIIVELMHLLKNRKFEQYRYRCERITDYITRYLNKQDDLLRFVYFFRLLQSVARGGFQKEEVIKKSKPYLKKLQSCTPSIGADIREVEVVPFERLWEMALGCLR